MSFSAQHEELPPFNRILVSPPSSETKPSPHHLAPSQFPQEHYLSLSHHLQQQHSFIMSSSARREMIRRHPNRSRLEAAEKADAHRAANPPPFHGPQDLDNPLSFLTAYDHSVPTKSAVLAMPAMSTMPLCISPNLPAYNRMILAPSEQFALQQTLGSLRQLLLNRVIPPMQAVTGQTGAEQVVSVQTPHDAEKPTEKSSVPNRPAGHLGTNTPVVFSDDFKSRLNTMINEGYTPSDSPNGIQPQSQGHIDLEPPPRNDRYELEASPSTVRNLRNKDYTQKRLRGSTQPDEGKSGSSAVGKPPAKKARVAESDALGIMHQGTAPSGPTVSQSKTNTRKTRKSAVQDDPLYKPITPDLAQEATDDALVPEVDDLAALANSSAPRKGYKNPDPAYRYTRPDRAQEAADDAIRPDFDDITPSKPFKLVDPTFNPPQDDVQDEEPSNAKPKGKKKTPVKKLTAMKGPVKKTTSLKTLSIDLVEQNQNGQDMAITAFTPVNRLPANKVVKKPITRKKMIPKPATVESGSDSDPTSGVQSQSEKTPEPQQAPPQEKTTTKKTTPVSKKVSVSKKDTAKSSVKSETQPSASSKKPTPKKSAPAKQPLPKNGPAPVKVTTDKAAVEKTLARTRRVSQRTKK